MNTPGINLPDNFFTKRELKALRDEFKVSGSKLHFREWVTDYCTCTISVLPSGIPTTTVNNTIFNLMLSWNAALNCRTPVVEPWLMKEVAISAAGDDTVILGR